MPISFTYWSRLNIGSLKNQILIPGTCKCYLIWKEVFAHGTKLRILRWEGYPGLSRWALNAVISVLIRERQREIIPKMRRKCGHGSRDWSDVATSQGMPASPGARREEGMDSLQNL